LSCPALCPGLSKRRSLDTDDVKETDWQFVIGFIVRLPSGPAAFHFFKRRPAQYIRQSKSNSPTSFDKSASASLKRAIITTAGAATAIAGPAWAERGEVFSVDWWTYRTLVL
jgi:hypothetical protein